MADRFTLYRVLGVDADATLPEIKAAFRMLAKKYHPDRNPGDSDAATRFSVVLNAWETLGDEELRAEYDASERNTARVRGGVMSGSIVGGCPVPRGGGPAGAVSGTSGREPVEGEFVSSVDLVMAHINTVLWDIELLLPRAASEATVAGEVLRMLTFIDYWVLEAAGYPDYFFAARGVKGPSVCPGVPELPGSHSPAGIGRASGASASPPARGQIGHGPYVDVEDYFFSLRRRADRFIGRAALADVLVLVHGTKKRLLDGILEAFAYCTRHLAHLRE